MTEEQAILTLRPWATEMRFDPAGKLVVLGFARHGTQIGDEHVKTILACKNLNQLSLTQTQISGVGLAQLSDLPNLQFIDLPEDITPDGIRTLRRFPRLEAAGLTLQGRDREKLKAVAELHQLRVLRIDWADEYSDEDIPLLAPLYGSLHSINVPPMITDTGIVYFTEFMHLTRLPLARCSRVTDVGLEEIVKLSKLEHLELPPKTTDEGLQQVAQSQTISVISCAGTKITDEGMTHLAAMPQLRIAMLPQSITDAGAKQLLGHRNLSAIVLFGSDVSDDMIAQLKEAAPDGKLVVTRR